MPTSTLPHHPTIGIIAAIEREFLYLKERITPTRHEKISNFNFYFGTFAGKNIVLAQSDVGKVNAAICTTLLIEIFKCQIILNTGSAAALRAGIAIGDVVISEQVMHHDVDVTAFGYALGQIPRMPVAYSADSALIDIAKRFSRASFPYQIHTGDMISGDSFVNDTTFIKEKFLHASALDMESGAVAQTCHCFNIPFVIIRSISDNGEKDAHISFNKFIEIAGENSAILAEFVVKAL